MANNAIKYFFTEQSSVGVSFDQAEYTVAEGMQLTVTGRLTGLTGVVETDFSLDLITDYDIDPLTSEHQFLLLCVDCYSLTSLQIPATSPSLPSIPPWSLLLEEIPASPSISLL